MLIVIEVLMVLTIFILLFKKLFFNDINDENLLEPRKSGLYVCDIIIDGETFNVKSEVELEREYGDDISISHVKIYGIPEEKGEAGLAILLNEHTIVSKDDVKWVK